LGAAFVAAFLGATFFKTGLAAAFFGAAFFTAAFTGFFAAGFETAFLGAGFAAFLAAGFGFGAAFATFLAAGLAGFAAFFGAGFLAMIGADLALKIRKYRLFTGSDDGAHQTQRHPHLLFQLHLMDARTFGRQRGNKYLVFSG